MIETLRDKMVTIADKYCEVYGITRQDLFQTHKYRKGGKRRVLNGVNISSIRMALGYYLSNHFPVTLTEVALLIGYNDHSTVSYNNQKIYFYIKNKDPFFMSYYSILEQIGQMYEPIKFTRIRQKAIYA